ncbi:MAG: hypothetical protein U0228_27410 [Myxococcaceae bacterium]
MHALVLAVGLFSGGLSDQVELRSARLIDDGAFTFLGRAMVHQTQNDELASLERERLEIEDSNRPIVVPIVLLATGVTSYIVGSVIFAVTTSLGAALVGVVLVLAATALVVTGTIMLISAIVHNAKSASRLRHLDERIQQLRSGAVTPFKQGEEPPPPPPPPPSSHLVPVVAPQVLLATF